MEFPRVEIQPGETLARAEEKVERAFEAQGAQLLAFTNLNALLPTSRFCHFFQVEYGGRQCVIVVITEPWDEETLVTVLNVLLEMRVDPEPPGARLVFHFYSAYEVPEVLRTLFGDSDVSEFESRVCLVTRYGSELEPAMCLQIAATAAFLSRQVFGLRVRLLDPGALQTIADLATGRLRQAGCPSDPLNSLIALGCLYGEILRSQLACPSNWQRIPQFEPWPGLLFWSNKAGGQEARPAAGQIAFNPIAHVIHAYKSGDTEHLPRVTRELEGECRRVLGGGGPSAKGPAQAT